MADVTNYDPFIKAHLATLDLCEIPAVNSWETNKAIYDRLYDMCSKIEDYAMDVQDTLRAYDITGREERSCAQHLRIETENSLDNLECFGEMIDGMRNVQGFAYFLSLMGLNNILYRITACIDYLVQYKSIADDEEVNNAVSVYTNAITSDCLSIKEFLNVEDMDDDTLNSIISMYDEKHAMCNKV